MCFIKKSEHTAYNLCYSNLRGDSGSIVQKKVSIEGNFIEKLVDPTGSPTTDTAATASDTET